MTPSSQMASSTRLSKSSQVIFFLTFSIMGCRIKTRWFLSLICLLSSMLIEMEILKFYHSAFASHVF
jgi:hypothetical protein